MKANNTTILPKHLFPAAEKVVWRKCEQVLIDAIAPVQTKYEFSIAWTVYANRVGPH